MMEQALLIDPFLVLFLFSFCSIFIFCSFYSSLLLFSIFFLLMYLAEVDPRTFKGMYLVACECATN